MPAPSTGIWRTRTTMPLNGAALATFNGILRRTRMEIALYSLG
jgi:hypothetical protein